MRRFWYFFGVLCIAFPFVGCQDFQSRTKDYEFVGELENGHALCMNNQKWFFVDEEGVTVTNIYDKINEFHNGYAVAKDDKRVYYLINENLKEIPVRGKIVTQVNKDGNVWIYHEKGDTTYNKYNERQISHVWKLYSIIDNKVLVEVKRLKDNWPIMTEESMSEDLETGIAVLENTAYGPDGSVIVPQGKFNQIYGYHNGLCKFEERVSRGFVYGYLDVKGDIAIPAKFDRADSFNESGYAKVEIGTFYNMKRCYIDKNGNVLKGGDLALAKSTFLEDEKDWAVGYNSDGECFLVNKAGEKKILGKGIRAAKYKDIFAIRESNIYKVLRNVEGTLEDLCEIKRSGAEEEYLHIGKDPYGDPQISLYYNKKVDVYNQHGDFVESRTAEIGPRYLIGGERDEDGEWNSFLVGTLKF